MMKSLSIVLLLAVVVLSVASVSVCASGPVKLALTRGNANPKAAAMAAAGHKGYQMHLAAMSHAAELHRAERAMHAEDLNGQDFTSPLLGCPFAIFTVPAVIGSKTFELLLDTGSSTLAVAGASCSNCAGVSPLWSSTTSSVNTGVSVTGRYGDGSGWAGTAWTDSVSIGDGIGGKVSPSVSTNIAVVTRQSATGVDATGKAQSTAGPFFVKDSCVDDSAAERAAIPNQGILGMAFASLAAPGTDSFIQNLLSAPSSPTGLDRVFALELCAHSGNLWVGGVDNSTFKTPMLTTPLVKPYSYYSIDQVDIEVDGVSLGLDQGSFTGGVNIVDSGTTLWQMPQAVYLAVINKIMANANFKKYFRSSPSNNFFQNSNGQCETAGTGGSYQVLQSSLPTLSLRLANGLLLTMDGVGSYLLPCSSAYNQWTFGITGGDSGTIAGWPLINQFIVSHDLDAMTLGFAPQQSCTSSKPTLRTAVTMGTAAPPYAGGDSSSVAVGAASSIGAVAMAMLAVAAALMQ